MKGKELVESLSRKHCEQGQDLGSSKDEALAQLKVESAHRFM